MRYAVIVCPKCGKARGVESVRKTTTCPCGRRINVSRVKFQFEPTRPRTRERSRRGERAASEGRSSRPEGDLQGPLSDVAERARAVKDPLERHGGDAVELTACGGEFGDEDMKRVAALVGRESAEDMIARLQEHGLVYETADGRFRSV